MKFYHGSKDGSIKELSTSHSGDGKVYVTNSRLVALSYAVRGYPNLFTTLKSGKEAFLELVPDLFEKMIKGKTAYIYTLENKEYIPVIQNNKCGHTNCYCCNENVSVIEKEYIKDAYVEFFKYIENGEFIVVNYKDIPNREQKIKDIFDNSSKVDFTNKTNYLNLLK